MAGTNALVVGELLLLRGKGQGITMRFYDHKK
jgi:hypothetical protein